MTLELTERIIAGSPDDLMEVHHITLRGSNREIGYLGVGRRTEYLKFALGE